MTAAPSASAPRPPRGLVLGASAWIAISWLALMGPRPPLQPTSLSYTPAIRMMVQSMLVLTVVAWPLVRLSVPARPRPVISAALDTVAMLIFWQIVLWPMRLVTTWPIGRVLLVDAEAVAACLTTGAIVAWCPRSRAGRTLGMAALMVWAVGLPGLAAALGGNLPPGLAGPFVRAWLEAGLGPGPIDPSAVRPAAFTAMFALAGWLAASGRDPDGAGDKTASAVL